MRVMRVVLVIDVINNVDLDAVEKRFVVETLVTVLMNFNWEGIDKYEDTICPLTVMGSYSYAPKKLDMDFKNRPTPMTKPLIE